MECPYCGEELSEDAERCHKCHAELLLEEIGEIEVFEKEQVYIDPKSFEEVPSEVLKWNWGAMFLYPIWALAMNLLIWFLVWIIIKILMVIIIVFQGELGLKGWGLWGFWGLYISENILYLILGAIGGMLAWKKRKWKSLDEFVSTQRVWAYWAFGYITIYILLLILVRSGVLRI